MRYWRTADLDKTPNYLMHHGIEGQKWGVRHGPPYPLGSDVSTGNRLKDVSGSDKRENAAVAVAVAALYALPIGLGVGAAVYDSHRLNTHKDRADEYKRNFKKTIEPELGKDAKKIADGDADTINKYKKEGDPKVVSKKELKAINAYGMENPYAKKRYKDKVDQSIIKESLGNGWVALRPVREAYGRTRNCPNCATAFNLNKLGWTFRAAPVEKNGRPGKQITAENKKMFKGISVSDIESKNDFKNVLKNMPDGSFGSFGFNYRGKGGHILNWAVENGKPKIYDAQNGTRMSVNAFLSTYDPSFGDTNEFYDLTNVTSIDWNKVSEYKYTY